MLERERQGQVLGKKILSEGRKLGCVRGTFGGGGKVGSGARWPDGFLRSCVGMLWSCVGLVCQSFLFSNSTVTCDLWI